LKKEVIIVGGGIVGLATAYLLLKSKPGIKLLLLEKESAVAQHQTGHNSGVIHSGLYYKPGSLKAKNCISGYHQLLAFCDEHHIEYEICGKIVVATDEEQIPLLDNLHQRGQQNGLEGLKSIPEDALVEYEPHVAGLKGLWVPQTGIINYTEVAKVLARSIELMGGEILLEREVINIESGIREKNSTTRVNTPHEIFETSMVVNCAGLHSDRVARFTEPKLDVRIIPFRGEYYQLKTEKEYLVKNLIYPVPDPSFPFLGVHFTRMKKGGVEAGPNAVLALAREGYKKSDINLKELMASLSWPGFQKIAFKYWGKGLGEIYRSYSKSAFTRALQKLIPEITENDLVPHGAGVRAQASSRNGGLLDDFYIIENQSGVHLCNAPSPAATSSLAIGTTISKRVLERLT
jgi:L-2-hydroxyglutarate oxidase